MLTSNEYHKGLNNRFDKRIARIHKMGFRRVNNEFGSFFVRGMIRTNSSRNQTIPAGLLLSADNRLWNEKLAEVVRR